MIQEDETYLRRLFEELQDENQTDERRRELAGFLRELCTFSQMLQIGNRDEFFKSLADLSILQTIESLLASDDSTLRQLGVDVFAHVVEHSPSMVREFAHREMQESNGNDDELLINLVIEQMICDPDPELSGAMQLMNLLRILLDPENMMANKNEKTEFLSFFYYHCMHVLMAPLLANTAEDKPSKGDYQTAHLLSLILELITFSVEHHTYHVKNYILNKDLLRRILVLLNSRHTFLALATLRFLRKIISMMDEFYYRYIVKGNLLKPVVDVLFCSGSRYNLLNSAVLEMFEFIRTEDMKSLISYIAEKHLKELQKIDYVQTFIGIKQRYEQQKDREKHGGTANSVESVMLNNRFRRDARAMDEDEEMWFEAEDEENTEPLPFSSPSDDAQKLNIDKILEDNKDDDDFSKTKKNLLDDNPGNTKNDSTVNAMNNHPAPQPDAKSPIINGIEHSLNSNSSSMKPETSTTSPTVTVKTGLVGLVDYSDDDSEEEEDDTDQKNESNGKSDVSHTDKIKADITSAKSDLPSAPVDTEPARKKPRLQVADGD